MQKSEILESVNVDRLSSLDQEIKRLQSENVIMCKIATRKGFFEYYFEQLKNHKTTTECFDYVNNLYQNYFGEYKFNSFQQFKTA